MGSKVGNCPTVIQLWKSDTFWPRYGGYSLGFIRVQHQGVQKGPDWGRPRPTRQGLKQRQPRLGKRDLDGRYQLLAKTTHVYYVNSLIIRWNKIAETYSGRILV